MATKDIDLSIIIPAYKEHKDIQKRLEKLADWLKKHDYGTVEVIIMAQSDDDTGAAARVEAKLFDHFRVINLGQRAGKGGAVRAGMFEARGRYRMFMDADLATPLKHLDDVKRLMDEGAKVGIAVRDLPRIHKGWLRKSITSIGNILAQVILLPGIKDTQCGFKVFEAVAAEAIFARQTILGWGFDLEILAIARHLGYHVETFGANDWKDPKAVGLVGDSAAGAALQTFKDLVSIRFGLINGRYDQKNFTYKGPDSARAPMKKRKSRPYNPIIASNRRFMGLTLVLAALVRFIGLAHSSVWHDEGYTMFMVSLPPHEIITHTALDVHPPLYYLTLHYWMILFGSSEIGARSLSLVLMLGVIVFMYLTMKRLFDQRVARLTALFLALAPFLVRYSQEARMYGMLAFIASLATYMLTRALDSGRVRDYIMYGIIIAAGLYTYYYVIFLIALHWGYIGFRAIYPKFSWKSVKANLFEVRWIGANALAVILFAPWLPTAYRQFTSIQGAYWIPKVTGDTIPSTIAQFLTYTDLGAFQKGGASASHFLPSLGLRTLIFVTLIAAVIGLLYSYRRRHLDRVVLLTLFTALAPVTVFLLSSKRPIYVDRYFVFAAVGFYALLAVILICSWPWIKYPRLQRLAIILTSFTLIVGITNVYRQGAHQMRQLAAAIQEQYQPGDAIVNGDFYTFFDYRYYNHTGSPNLAYLPNGFPGCCEGKSLLYDHPELELKSFADLNPDSGYVWIIGHPGVQDYFTTALPGNWAPVGAPIVRGSLEAQRFSTSE